MVKVKWSDITFPATDVVKVICGLVALCVTVIGVLWKASTWVSEIKTEIASIKTERVEKEKVLNSRVSFLEASAQVTSEKQIQYEKWQSRADAILQEELRLRSEKKQKK